MTSVERRLNEIRLVGDALLSYMKHSTWCAIRVGLTKDPRCICGAWAATAAWEAVRPTISIGREVPK